MQNQKLSASFKLAAATAALAVCGVAWSANTTAAASVSAQQLAAATQTSDQTRSHKAGERHHKRMGHHVRNAAMWVPGYGPLTREFVDSLALTDSQAKLVEEAKADQKAQREERRTAMKHARVARLEQVKTGKIDPRATLKQVDEAQQKAQAKRREMNDNWLAVWDALDSAQQAKVATHLNERAEKLAKRVEQRKQLKDKARHDGKSAPAVNGPVSS
ncbi:MAG TPA: hypothetical protein VNQ97_07830 [Burkholderiaceae bacterium]|nr:hypothetical protein [Burkholderiaceae bacterium]